MSTFRSWLGAIGLASTAVCAFTLPGEASGPFESVYTKTDGPNCQTIHEPSENDENGGYALWTCGSVGGVSAIFADFDARQSVGYTAARDHFTEDDLGEMEHVTRMAPFNAIHKVMEWRVEKSGGTVKPFATILRYFTFIPQSNGEDYKGQVLNVTRLGPEGACVVARVDARANKNANKLATDAADTIAREARCDGREPVTIGRTTENSGF